MNDPALHDELDDESAVRAVLNSKTARAALLPVGATRVRLNNAAVRLWSEVGRSKARLLSSRRASGRDRIARGTSRLMGPAPELANRPTDEAGYV